MKIIINRFLSFIHFLCKPWRPWDDLSLENRSQRKAALRRIAAPCAMAAREPHDKKRPDGTECSSQSRGVPAKPTLKATRDLQSNRGIFSVFCIRCPYACPIFLVMPCARSVCIFSLLNWLLKKNVHSKLIKIRYLYLTKCINFKTCCLY